MLKRSGFWLAAAMISMSLAAMNSIRFANDFWGYWPASSWTIPTTAVLGGISIISMSIHLLLESRDRRKREFYRQIST